MTIATGFSARSKRFDAGQSVADIAMAALNAASDRPDCFVSLCPKSEVARQAQKVTDAMASGQDLPLAGLTFCVKDNIDVAGIVSSSNCPGYGRVPSVSAPAVELAQAAGAILIGKNTMDQFATGLNGTRAPDPICQNALDPTIIPGGSSSGSAVAVAAGICDFSLGSDTGGSGRVPAATNGIVGLKPTPGLVSGRGMVYCNRSFDVIPIFAKTVDEAATVLAAIEGPDDCDPYGYLGPVADVRSVAKPRFAIPADLNHFGDADAAKAHQKNLNTLRASGAELIEIDFTPFAQAGALVFESALVAERLVDYGEFIANSPDAVVPPVAKAINAGRKFSAQDAFETLYRLQELKVICRKVMEGVDALVLPTIPRLFTVDEMLAEPMQRNTIMGTYTYFANPLGYAVVAVPGAVRDNAIPSSVSFVGPSGSDHQMIAFSQNFQSIARQAPLS